MNEQQQDQEHSQLQHQQELDQQWQEILRNDPEYAKWLDTLESMSGGAR